MTRISWKAKHKGSDGSEPFLIMLILFLVGVVVIVGTSMNNEQPPQPTEQELCMKDGGKWVTQTYMQVMPMFNGRSYVSIPTYTTVGHCEKENKS